MTLFYMLLAAVMSYALVLLFKQQALLKDRVTLLEREKQETEEMLLHFMEQVNGLTSEGVQTTIEQSASTNHSYETIAPSDGNELPLFNNHQDLPDSSSEDQIELTDVKNQLEAGADIDQLARSLKRGTGEVALIAKLSQKTKVARR